MACRLLRCRLVRGKLDVFPVCDLLRFGLRDGCTGVIELVGPNGPGRIAFAHGWILEASSPAVEGYPSSRNATYAALQDLMSWVDGRFSIEISSNDPIRLLALEVELARLLRQALADKHARDPIAHAA